MKILHCFADSGVESEALTPHGDVFRIGLHARNTNDSRPIKADANHLPIKEDVKFDLGLFHPMCNKWSNAPTEKEEVNQIPLAREIAQEHCHEYIIENKPEAPLNDPVFLDGRMFGLPIANERAFETSYHVEQLPRQTRLETEHRVENTRPKKYWLNVKGYSSTDYNSRELILSGTPRPFIDYLVRPLL